MRTSKAKAGANAPRDSVVAARTGSDADAPTPAEAAFLTALDPITVQAPIYHHFAGAIERDRASRIWQWIERDLAPELCAQLSAQVEAGKPPALAFDAIGDDLLRVLKAHFEAEHDPDLVRRTTIQLGGEDTRKRLPYIVMAIRRRAQLDQAAQFGRALEHVQDQRGMVTALQTITIKNPVTRALWMQAMVAHMVNPTRAMGAAVKLAGAPGETALTNAGFGSLVDSILSHAQSQLSALMIQPGVFTDFDRACRAIDRFHRLRWSLNTNLELGRRSPWSAITSDLVSRISARLEQPLREVNANVTQALRRPREGADRINHDQVLAGFNGLYLLITVRKARESLAVNAVIESVWNETGQAIEVLVARALEAYRKDPSDAIARERVDAGIKMAEIRYNAEYADILRRARDAAARRAQPATSQA